jgi:uncharacterized MnhB-related membrane protein
MVYILLAAGILVCAVLSIRAKRLLISAIWLALTSALVSVLIFILGAPHIAVIELSVGAGLVTVLFVFAINIAGEEITDLKTVIPLPVAIAGVIIAVGLIITLILRAIGLIQFTPSDAIPSAILWEDRYLDILLQIVLIFSGVLGVIGLLAANKPESQAEDHV